MTFLSGILSNVIISLLSALGGWLLKTLHIWWQDKQEASVDEKKTADATRALQDAKTKEELDAAAKGIANNFPH